jgi:membrane fusion protein (multidrug efflux system)
LNILSLGLNFVKLKTFQVGLFFGLITLVACKHDEKKTDKFNPNAPVSVDVTVAELQKIDRTVQVNGSVIANDFVELKPEVSGRITSLQVPEGKVVPAGTIIAKLNDADLQAQLAKIKTQLELAIINEQRNKQLLSVKGINQSDYDISAQQVKSYKADLDYTQSLIDKTVVKAPFAGQVGLRQVSLGAFVTTATTIVTIQKTNDLKIDFTLPEIYGSYVKVGKTVSFEGISEGKLKGNAAITAIEPQIIASTRNIKVRAKITSKLLPGAYVKVFLPESASKPSILVPSNIIIPDSKSKSLFVVKNGKAKSIEVETGYRTQNAVEIVSGLKSGDTVVVAGMLFVKNGSNTKVGKVLKNTDIAK